MATLAQHDRYPESQLQRAVLAHLEVRAAPYTFWFHVPNGGARTATEGAILKGLGVRAGVPDLIIVHGGRFYGLELKTPSGQVSPAQEQTLASLRSAGALTAVAVGLDDALRVLEGWGLLRPSRSLEKANQRIG
jgi:hypothetical protein